MDGFERYEKVDLSLGVGRAYMFVILAIVPLTLILASIYTVFWGIESYFAGLGALTSLPGILAVLILGILLHEVLHALGWSLFGGIPVKEVKFGILWKALTPYAHVEQPISASAYRAGTFSPALIMGFGPYILGLLMGNAWVANFGLLYLLAAGGDLLVLWTIRRVPGEGLVIDHPSRVGCVLLKGEPGGDISTPG